MIYTNSPKLDLNTLFPFPLDDFQKQAISALDAGKSLVVCAPTGSGKTLIGEYSIYKALTSGKRVFYTTPLKALSNQKLRDFRQQFGEENVGLLTGDTAINRDATVVIMTTEIFRNMLYGTPIGEVGVSLQGVGTVILDECHYMNDKERGTVWEESIIYCPKNIALVALSATVANSQQLTDWFNKIHGETELIYSDFRPVPLEYYFCSHKGVFPLLDEEKKQINPRLKEKKVRQERVKQGRRFAEKFNTETVINTLKNWQERGLLPNIYYVYGRRDGDRLVDEMQNLSLVTQNQSKQIQKHIEQFGEYNPDIWKHRRTRDLIDSLTRGIGLYHLEMSPLSRSLVTTVFQSGLLQILIIPETLYTVTQLQQRDMLPGIYFIFSRVGCDFAVQECYLAIEELKLISLITPAETAELKQRIDEFLALNPDAARNDKIEYLYRGVAAHHAGILPVWKALIEELFGKGLIKIVFATETLAAGINMPARTTVISSISKRTDEGHRLLTASEFLQMSGRAGRRGKDKIGHVVTLQTPFEGAEIAAKLATKGADPLISQFTPSYGMVLNLLQTHSLTEIKELIERSFGQYLATLDLKPYEEELKIQQRELIRINDELGEITEEQIENFIKLSESLKEGKRLVRILVKQAEKEQAKQVSNVILSAEPGMIVYLKGKHIPTGSPIPALLVSKIKNSEQVSYLICLSKSNKWYVCSISDVIDYEAEKTIKNIPIPPFDLSFKLGEKRKGTKEDGEFVADIPAKYEGENLAPEVREQIAKVEEMERLLKEHPVQKIGDTKTAIAYQEEREILKMQIEELEETIEQMKEIHWQQFLDLIAILQQTKALEELKPTKLGEIAAALRGENELWLGIALYSGLLDDLDPHHLAAICASLVIETPRPDSWTEYNFSSEVETVINDLRRRKRDLLHIQYKYQVMMPLWLEDGLIGLIEKWALGVKWLELCQNTSLDEGDLVRMLRRTLDLLSQIPHVPNIPDSLKQNAIRAIQLIDRFPVNELVT